jgi:hypothetical protein
MDGAQVDSAREPICQVHIKTLCCATTNPLAVTYHDVEIRLAVPKVQEDLVLVGRPRYLVETHFDSGFLFKDIPQFLQAICRIPLRPPYGDGPILNIGFFTATRRDQDGQKESRREPSQFVHRSSHEYFNGCVVGSSPRNRIVENPIDWGCQGVP